MKMRPVNSNCCSHAYQSLVCVRECVCARGFSAGGRRGLLRAIIDLTELQDHFYSHFHIHVTSAFLVPWPRQYYPLLCHPCLRISPLTITILTHGTKQERH